MSVRMFKLVSGEFMIGETKVNSDNKLAVTSPMIVHFAPHSSGQLAIQMFPLNPFATSKNEEVKFQDDHIMFETSISDNLEKEYIRITSGIVTTKVMPKLELVKP